MLVHIKKNIFLKPLNLSFVPYSSPHTLIHHLYCHISITLTLFSQYLLCLWLDSLHTELLTYYCAQTIKIIFLAWSVFISLQVFHCKWLTLFLQLLQGVHWDRWKSLGVHRLDLPLRELVDSPAKSTLVMGLPCLLHMKI